MASGVNVKMGVSGVAQFKTNMNQAKQAVKTLDAQLALSEKQFKATGDSESYMTEKSELLKAKLEQQKSVLANAEDALKSMASNGIDKTSKAYQDMYRQMVSAKGEILDTEAALNGVADAGEEAGNGVDSMNTQLSHIGKGVDFQNVTAGISSITSGLENAAKKAINLGRKLFDAMIGAGEYADDLKTRASRYGLTTEELQRMDKTATLIDTDVDTIINAQKKLRKGIGSADKGVMGAYAELLGEGYDPRMRGWENAFWDAGEALMNFADEEQKEVYAQKLFGKSWNDLIPLFEAGREEYEKTNASWSVLSDEQIENLGKMDDEYQKLQQNIENLKMSILSEFAGPMASLMTTINEEVGKFTDWLQSDEGKATVDSVVGKVKEALEWIADPDNIQSVIGGLEAILGGWALLKVTGGALTVLKLINGITGLTSSAAGSAGAAAGASWGSSFATAAMKAAPFLAFLYTLLNPSGSAENDIDQIFGDDGELTTAGKEAMENGGLLVKNGQVAESNAPTLDLRMKTESWRDRYLNNLNNGKDFYDPLDQRPSYMRGMSPETTGQTSLGNPAGLRALEESADKMESAADDLSGQSESTRQSNSEMTAAAGQIKGLGGVIESAITSGMSGIKIYIDGQLAGNVLTPYINSGMAGIVAGLTR